MMLPKNLKELIEQGLLFPAILPKMNDYLSKISKPKTVSNLDLSKLDDLSGYTIPLIAHDYGAKTPIMWNTLYKKLSLNIRNIMMVADPSKASIILAAFKEDPKYLGGGFGVGFKEQLDYLDIIKPSDLKAVNIVVKEKNKLVGYNTDALGLVKSLENKLIETNKTIESSNIVLLGAGGVSKEVARLIASKKPNRIAILNRSFDKAIKIAHEINEQYGKIAVAGGEDIIRGYILNSFTAPDVIINTTDKGSDGRLVEYSALAAANPKNPESKGNNSYISRELCRNLANLYPKTIIADIVLPKEGLSTTLRHAIDENLQTLNGKPMVINQAGPAYVYIQNSYPDLHTKKVTEDEAIKVFKKAANI